MGDSSSVIRLVRSKTSFLAVRADWNRVDIGRVYVRRLYKPREYTFYQAD